MAKHQDTLEDWERTGGPAVDHVIDAARGLSKRTGMTFRESVETIIETVYQRLGWKSDRGDDPENLGGIKNG